MNLGGGQSQSLKVASAPITVNSPKVDSCLAQRLTIQIAAKVMSNVIVRVHISTFHFPVVAAPRNGPQSALSV